MGAALQFAVDVGDTVKAIPLMPWKKVLKAASTIDPGGQVGDPP